MTTKKKRCFFCRKIAKQIDTKFPVCDGWSCNYKVAMMVNMQEFSKWITLYQTEANQLNELEGRALLADIKMVYTKAGIPEAYEHKEKAVQSLEYMINNLARAEIENKKTIFFPRELNDKPETRH